MNLGKLSSDDLRLFLFLAEKLESETIEAQQVLVEKRDSLFASDCLKPSWSHLYELPILLHVTQWLDPDERTDYLQQIANSPNQIQLAQESLLSFDADMQAWEPDEAEKEDLRTQLAAIFAFSYSLTQSFRALKIFGLYLNDLIAIVRGNGPNAEKAVLAAVKIDRTVLACPSINTYISQRVLLNDAAFLRKLKRAENGKLTSREQRNYQQMRLVLQVLKEVGATKLTSKDLYQLFVDELDLITKDRNGDIGNVEENLRQFAYQFMNQKAVS